MSGRAPAITPVLDTIDIDATNPFNPFGVTLDETNYDRHPAPHSSKVGPRRFDQTVKTIYGVATLDGRFNMLAGEWYWDVNAAYGRNKAKQTMLGNINSRHLRQALGPIADACQPRRRDACRSISSAVPARSRRR